MSDIINIIDESEINDINDVRAIDYYDAVDLGLEPKSYDIDIPIGTHTLKLIFKVWARNNSLKCYFQVINNGQRHLVIFLPIPKTNIDIQQEIIKLIFLNSIFLVIFINYEGRTQTDKPKI